MLEYRMKQLTDDCKELISLAIGCSGSVFDNYSDDDLLMMKKSIKLMNDSFDLAVKSAEIMDKQQETIDLMYQEIKELRRLIEKNES